MKRFYFIVLLLALSTVGARAQTQPQERTITEGPNLLDVRRVLQS